MTSIGLDLSINSTGVCVRNIDDGKTIYYIIGSKFTKKTLDYQQDNLNFIQYDKQQPPSSMEYHMKEAVKTGNIYRIIQELRSILLLHHPDVAAIEGVSFQSNGSVLDLCGLNYMVRMTLEEMGIKYYIVSPTQNKKYATGNGQAEKDVMISAWNKIEPTMRDVSKFIKIDDLADAYFLARYGEHLYSLDKCV